MLPHHVTVFFYLDKLFYSIWQHGIQRTLHWWNIRDWYQFLFCTSLRNLLHISSINLHVIIKKMECCRDNLTLFAAAFSGMVNVVASVPRHHCCHLQQFPEYCILASACYKSCYTEHYRKDFILCSKDQLCTFVKLQGLHHSPSVPHKNNASETDRPLSNCHPIHTHTCSLTLNVTT